MKITTRVALVFALLLPAIAALLRLIGFIKSGKVHVQIGHTLPLSHAAEAHKILAARASAGKIILKPWSYGRRLGAVAVSSFRDGAATC